MVLPRSAKHGHLAQFNNSKLYVEEVVNDEEKHRGKQIIGVTLYAFVIPASPKVMTT
jgi:hypothetical protein